MLALSIMTTRTKREKGHIGDDKHLVHPLSEFHQLWDLFMTVRRRVAASPRLRLAVSVSRRGGWSSRVGRRFVSSSQFGRRFVLFS
jgi:hypothetical protein